MERALASAPLVEDVAFRDGLGERRRTTDAAGVVRELLRLRAELTLVPAFEFALRERVARLSEFRHPYFAQTRTVERLLDVESSLGVVSDQLDGIRLSQLFTLAAARGLNLDINAALCLIRQIVPAIARLHDACRDVAHGALGPERVVLTATGRLMVTEYVLGAALEQLHYSQERYWRDLRIAVPRCAGLPQFDARTDVTQIGIIALSLVLGRNLRDDEYPGRIGDVVNSAKAIAPRGGFEPLPVGLRTWLYRALQLDARHSFHTVGEANDELERVLSELEYPGLPASVDAFLTRYHEADFAGVPLASPAPIEDLFTAVIPHESHGVPIHAADVQVVDAAAGSIAAAPPLPRAALSNQDEADLAEFPSERELSTSRAGVESKPAHNGAREIRVDGVVDEINVRHLFGTPPEPASGRWKMALGAALAIGALIAVGPAMRRFRAAPAAAPTGILVVKTQFAGATALLDGQPVGTTPLTITVSVGPHTLELLAGGASREVPVTISGGARLEQYIEMPTATAVSSVASPDVATDTDTPPSPVTVPNSPTTVSAVGAPAIAAGPAAPSVSTVPPPSGSVTVQSPISLVAEIDGRVFGPATDGPLSLPPGTHTMTLRSERFGFQTTKTVSVDAGKTAAVSVVVPYGKVALNAQPWAELWVDGKPAGETPIGNLALPVGTHDVVFRHPEYGEHREHIDVMVDGVSRLSVDLRKP